MRFDDDGKFPETRSVSSEFPNPDTIKWEFPEKEKLEITCQQSVERVLSSAKLIISEGVEPKTRALTIKKLSKTGKQFQKKKFNLIYIETQNTVKKN